jgi:hypothetical protein
LSRKRIQNQCNGIQKKAMKAEACMKQAGLQGFLFFKEE